MREADLPTFVAMLDQTCSLLSKGNHKPDAQASAMWFRVLSAYEFETVRAAFDAHIRDADRGRFVPVPADIIGKIHANDGRPNADEAWGIAVKATDQTITVTWNDEIAQAWAVAEPVWGIGDEVGARMAFRDAYNRITAKNKGQPVNWWLSLGHDPNSRLPEAVRAQAAGLLQHTAALMLQAPDDQTLARLSRNAPPHAREALLALRDKLTARSSDEAYTPNPDLARTAELKQQAQDLTDEFARSHA